MASPRKSPIEPGGALSGALFRTLATPAAAVSNTQPGSTVGPWRVLSALGQGGSSEVFLAERGDDRFHQRVALKICQPSERLARYFRREREILSGLSHPGIARLIDGGEETDGRLWFAMEPVFGIPIDRHVASRQSSWRTRLELIVAVCQAVQYAHGRLLVHRDIKPSNILVDEEGRPKILDFGIALQNTDDASDLAMTRTVSSPEQRAGGVVTVASDIYQIGLLLQLLTGDPSLAMPARARADLRLIVAKATEEGPENRYPTAAALAADLSHVLATRPISLRTGLWYRSRVLVEKHFVPMAAIAVLCVLLAWLAIASALSLKQERDQSALAAHTARQAQLHAEAVSEFLVSIFSSADPNENRGAKLTANQILSNGERRLDDKFAGDPALRAALSLEIGRVYGALGEYERAKSVLERALARSASQADPGPIHLLRLQSQLGTTFYYLGNYGEAAAAFDRADAFLDSIGNRLDRDIEEGKLLNRRAILEKRLGRLDSALQKQTRALQLLEAALGLGDRSALAALNNLGNLHYARGEIDDSVAILERCWNLEIESLGSDHPLTQQTTNNLVNALLAADEVERAARVLPEAIDADKKLGTLGIERAQTLMLAAELARRQGDPERAESLALQGQRTFSARLGDGHPYVLNTTELLGHVALDRRDFATAARLFGKTLIGRRRLFDRDNQYVADAHYSLGLAYLGLQRFAKAQTQFRLAHRIRERISPNAAISKGRELLGLGEALIGSGQFEQAAEVLENAHHEFSKTRFELRSEKARLAAAAGMAAAGPKATP